jgi:hypothetical protein
MDMDEESKRLAAAGQERTPRFSTDDYYDVVCYHQNQGSYQ